jgi:hypothetical protein
VVRCQHLGQEVWKFLISACSYFYGHHDLCCHWFPLSLEDMQTIQFRMKPLKVESNSLQNRLDFYSNNKFNKFRGHFLN